MTSHTDQNEKTGYISMLLTPAERELLDEAKKKSGIKNTTDLIRHLITKYVRQDV